MPVVYDEYYLDYKNVDTISSNPDGSVTIKYFNKTCKTAEGNSITISLEIINGWKQAFNALKKQ